MTQELYLDKLRYTLRKLPDNEITDTIREIKIHFHEGLKQNRSEADIINALGNPKLLAQSITLEYDINALKGKNNFLKHLSMIGKLLSLGLKNLFLLPIFAVAALFMLTMYMMVVLFYFAAMLLVIAPILKFIFPWSVNVDPMPIWSIPIIGVVIFYLTRKLHKLINKLSLKLYKFLLRYLKSDYHMLVH